MATLTSHFGWLKPVVNDPIDQDQWGDQLNSNLDDQDDLVYNISRTGIGTSRPTYAVAGTLWIDNTDSTWLLYVYDGSQDILIGDIDPVDGSFVPAGEALLTTKGDLLTHSATEDVRLGVGANNTVLTADSTQAAGIKWSTVSAQLGAWFHATMSGTTITVAAQSNVSSITYVSTGNYIVNFTTAMPSANYSAAGILQRKAADAANDGFLVIPRGSSQTANTFPVMSIDASSSPTNRDLQSFNMIFVGG